MRYSVAHKPDWASVLEVLAEHDREHQVESPRERLDREHADFLARAPIREVVEHFLEDAQVWEHSRPRVRLSCGHVQFHTERPRIRCASCWRELGPAGQRDLFDHINNDKETSNAEHRS